MSSSERPGNVMRSYWAAECRRDLDRVLAHYAPGAVLRDPTGTYRGREEVARYYVGSMRDFPMLEIEVVGEVSDGNRGAFEFEARLGASDGSTVLVRGLSLVSVRDGLLESVHCYEDAAEEVTSPGSGLVSVAPPSTLQGS